MMGLLKRLFNPESAGSIVDKLADGVDDAVFTSQEKMELKIKLLDALGPFKIVQRILAFSACAHWVFAGVNVIGAVWVKALTDGRIDAVESLLNYALSDYVLWPTLAVFSLYCGGGFLESRNRK